ncbi:ABC transporter permease [Thermasporomyces composti]|jgi:ribose transport system permease protein|uniref:Monosaccharide ABC transporter membrane protein (CUT2 family) n=1 Tax=Thermasporomyces composti TaxID=696763 RepID=A0A3D9VC00_THECX|nr:ABC transporter permease [Thermasporomyces composti]REF36585.1 monosaccharide ABC transporter membrane protein (CUT2 family) [Thermasporomyces composti]
MRRVSDAPATKETATSASSTSPRSYLAAPHRWLELTPSLVRRQFQQLLAFASLLVIVIFFSVVNPHFSSRSNLTGILESTTVVGILALGTTFVIITGGIELSLGTGMTLTAVLTGIFLVHLGLPLPVGVLCGILSGALIGFINGTTIAFLGIPPFIATLATMLIAEGLALVISGAAPIYFSEVAGFTGIARGTLIPWLPNGVLILFVLTVIAAIVLNKTLLGRYTFAIGSNEEAAKISGVNVRRWKIAVYTLSGAFMGVAGLVLAARLNSAQPALGVGYELQAIAAVVIGGTSLQGGKGSILGTLIGALIVGTVTNGLRIMSVEPEWQTVIIGIVILLAVYTDILRRGRAST